MLREGRFYPGEGLERIVAFHERQEQRYAEAAAELSRAVRQADPDRHRAGRRRSGQPRSGGGAGHRPAVLPERQPGRHRPRPPVALRRVPPAPRADGSDAQTVPCRRCRCSRSARCCCPAGCCRCTCSSRATGRWCRTAWQPTTPEFGVVLIDRGHEVGGGDVRRAVGTVARMLQVAQLDGGRYAVVAVGTRRIRVDEWLPDDPYPRADVSDWPDDEPTATGATDLDERYRARGGQGQAHHRAGGRARRRRRRPVHRPQRRPAGRQLPARRPRPAVVGRPVRPALRRRPAERLALLDERLDDVDAMQRFRLGVGLRQPSARRGRLLHMCRAQPGRPEADARPAASSRAWAGSSSWSRTTPGRRPSVRSAVPGGGRRTAAIGARAVRHRHDPADARRAAPAADRDARHVRRLVDEHHPVRRRRSSSRSS